MKFLMAVLFTVLSFSATAETIKIENNGNITAYVDTDLIRKTGNLVMLPALLDFKEKIRGFSSAVLIMEYNCETGEQRLLKLVEFSGAMGTGDKTDDDTERSKFLINKWIRVNPMNSLDEYYFKLACK